MGNDYLEDVFGNAGILSQRFKGYQQRQGQRQFTDAVHYAFDNREHLIAEAPCGTGKSVAYLVPATRQAADHKMTTIVVTAAINLQEQLAHKDLPFLQEVLPWKFSFALLKGRAQYLCVSKYLDTEADQQSLSLQTPQHEDARKHLPILREWAKEAISGKNDGDVSNLPFAPHHEAWSLFSTNADECRGKRCKHADDCFALAAQRKAFKSDIIVTNYHMLYTNLAVYKDVRLDLVLPPFDNVILDEAHKAAPIAEDFFGFSMHHDSFKWLAKKLGDNDSTAATMERSARDLFNDLRKLKNDRNAYNKRLKGPILSTSLTPLVSSLSRAVESFSERARMGRDDDEKAKYEKLTLRAKTMRTNLLDGAAGISEESVFFLNEDHKGRIMLQSKLVQPANTLRQLLWSKTKNERDDETGEVIVGDRVTVVAASATLANGRSDLSYASRAMGAFGEARLVTGSPFDWSSCCLFVAPDDMPEPNAPDFQLSMGMAMVDIVTYARGRTLGLFTSFRNMNYAAMYLERMRVPFIVRKQGDAPRNQLIELFKRDTSSILLGTESFWAGVDVPGESLSCVVIDRLPFSQPDDPVMDAISEKDKNWFNNYALPKTIIALRQGFGRLIRSESDSGVVVCLDSRLNTKPYGKTIRAALPPVPKSTKMSDVEEWFQSSLPKEKIMTAIPKTVATEEKFSLTGEADICANAVIMQMQKVLDEAVDGIPAELSRGQLFVIALAMVEILKSGAKEEIERRESELNALKAASGYGPAKRERGAKRTRSTKEYVEAAVSKVLAAVADAPEAGLLASEVAAASGLDMKLVSTGIKKNFADKKIVKDGSGRATRYKAAKAAALARFSCRTSA